MLPAKYQTPYMVENHSCCNAFIHMMAARVRLDAKEKMPVAGITPHHAGAFDRAGFVLLERPMTQLPGRRQPPDNRSKRPTTI